MLFGAVWDDYIEDAVRALTFGADVDAVIQDTGDFYAVHNSEFAKDSTALHVAAAKGHTTLCELLLQNGATLESRNSSGKTPGDLALLHDQQLVLDVLERWLDAPDVASSSLPPSPSHATSHSGGFGASGSLTGSIGVSRSAGSTSGSSGVSPLTAVSSRLSLHRRRASQQPVPANTPGGFGNHPYDPTQAAASRAFPRPKHRKSVSLSGTEDITTSP
jgi:hypothetical protein